MYLVRAVEIKSLGSSGDTVRMEEEETGEEQGRRDW